MRYRFISQQQAGHSVHRLCALLGVSPSGYYRWRRQPVGVRARRDEALLPVIRSAFDSGRGVYGYCIRPWTIVRRSNSRPCTLHLNTLSIFSRA